MMMLSRKKKWDNNRNKKAHTFSITTLLILSNWFPRNSLILINSSIQEAIGKLSYDKKFYGMMTSNRVPIQYYI